MRAVLAAAAALALVQRGAGAVGARPSRAPVFDPSIGDLRAAQSGLERPEWPAEDDDLVRQLLGNMVRLQAASTPVKDANAWKRQSVREKAAQMAQVDIYSMVNGDEREPAIALNNETVAFYARLGVGSILNAPFNHAMPSSDHVDRTGWTASEWRVIITQIHEIYREHGKVLMVYGVDSIHGATYVRNATLFPQAISAAAAFNSSLVEEMGRISAKDTLAAGIPWMFSPVLGIAVQPKWARVYETFGEDPHVASELARAVITGIQTSGKVAACMKHFIGYSNPISGLDRADSSISEFDLLNYFAPSFRAAVDAGVKTAMEAYISVNGMPVIASHKLLTTLLRDDMGFTGILVSDYSEIDRMVYEHHVAATVPEAIRTSIGHTSLDMNMGPGNLTLFLDTVEKLVATGEIPESRLDASVSRILKLKQGLGLLTIADSSAKPLPMGPEPPDKAVGSPEDQQVALDIARESIVLLENKGSTLPLRQWGSFSVFLTGPASDNKGYLCGGWSVFWQGSSNSTYFPHGRTIKEALEESRQHFPFRLEHMNAVDIDGSSRQEDIDQALEIAARCKYTIIVLGEQVYAEKEGDIDDLAFPKGQLEYLERLTNIQSTKVIVVLVTGRPRTLGGAHKKAQAVLLSMLPCEQGGQAIVDVIFGRVNPSGKLPITYPRNEAHLMPYFHRVNTLCRPWIECQAEWPFGFGRSYTTFTYSKLHLSKMSVGWNDTTAIIEARVSVTNSGPRAGKEVVLLYISQLVRTASSPETKLLKRFQKLELTPGETKEVMFILNHHDWSYYFPSSTGEGPAVLITEPGEFVVSIVYTTSGNGDQPATRTRGEKTNLQDAGADEQRMWWRHTEEPPLKMVADSTAQLTESFYVI